MRNFKKIIAVVVTLVMLFAIASISASAATAPVFSLRGATEVNFTKAAAEGESAEYYELAVFLEDADHQVGAIDGVITYDPEVFTFKVAELGAALQVLEDGNTVENSIVDDGNGTIKFVGLSEEVGVWFVLKFSVIAEKEGVAFGLVARGANAEGTAALEVTTKATSATVTNEEMINMEGGAILQKTPNLETEPAQELTFSVKVDPDAVAAAEVKHGAATDVGVLFMYTKRLNYRELSLNMTDKTGLAQAEQPIEGDIADFTVNLANIKWNAMGVSVSARAYIKFTDGTVIYSKNFNNGFETNAGNARESVIGVAVDAVKAGHYDRDKAVSLGYDVANIQAIAELNTIVDQDRIDLLSFIADCYKKPETVQ